MSLPRFETQGSLFGSLTSVAADLFSDAEDLEGFVRQAGMLQGQADYYIQVCSGLNFRTSPRWGTRTRELKIKNS